jgi:hypothetical protein
VDTNEPIVYAPDSRLYMSMESHVGITLTGNETEELGGKQVPVALCPKQISYGVNRARTQTSAMRGL